MDYWMESFKEDAFLGVRENGDKLLIKKKQYKLNKYQTVKTQKKFDPQNKYR